MKKLMCSLLVLASQGVAIAQSTVSGTVKSKNDEALVGATIRVKDTYIGVSTNQNGSYELKNLKNGKYSIAVSYIGFETSEKEIEINGSNIELNFTLNPSSSNLDEITVNATRVREGSPVAHSNISKEELQANNLGMDLPILLDQTPSIVTTSDAGAGVGYTGMRIRGSDATRINVTVNGIPINDPESQGVWWVNMPDLASSTSSIQIQRGVGTSTNGAGAFGASINVNTLESEAKAYGELSSSFGSFNTYKNTVKFGSGLIDEKWTFDGRLSNIQSDGYIDRSAADLKSYYFSTGYQGKKSILKFITFAGHERTNQAWYGAPRTYMQTDRTFNPYTYKDEVDDYKQSHYQLHYVRDVNSNLKVNASLHYTRGMGFFEQYKGTAENTFINYGKESFSDYSLNDIVIEGTNITFSDSILIAGEDTIINQNPGTDTTVNIGEYTISETDLIRRRWLDNHFYGIVYSAEYTKGNIRLTVGGGANQYINKHYGEIIWAEYTSNGAIGHRYYGNEATKNDIHFFAKTDYDISDKLSILGDYQIRSIMYNFFGLFQVNDSTFNERQQMDNFVFHNPKVGLTYNLNSMSSIYGFAGIGNKEPNRKDYTENHQNYRPQHENMIDIETGYRTKGKAFYFDANLYYMKYKNQLVVTGERNDVGADIRTNVDDSYRAGIEFSGGINISKNLVWTGNITFSQNKIKRFVEYIDDWDLGGQIQVEHQNTDIAFSPSTIMGSQFIYTAFNSPKKGALQLALMSKYVGEQFLDNTSSRSAKLDAYFVNDLRIEYSVKNKLFKEMTISALVRNIFNEQYSSNGWVYRFSSENGTYGDIYGNTEDAANNRYNLLGVFPQAGINFLMGFTAKF